LVVNYAVLGVIYEPMAKSHFIIGTAGHIDHGKTSLIKALTGMETDRLKEEKERGISIDLGFAYIDLPDGTKAGIVDVPGHERFIKNMLAGATGIDMVLFVVAADDGVMPQTREHLDIMHLLGISNGLFVITKSDMVDERQVNKVTADVEELIHGTCLQDSPIVAVSSATGFGIDNLKKLISKEAQKLLSKPEGGFFRLPIDRSFSIKGFGTVVTGTVASGMAQKNDEVVIISKDMAMPRKVKIRGIQSHFKAEDSIAAGQRAAINLSGISHTDIERGDMLASPDMDMITDIADVSFEFLPLGTDLKSVPKPIKNYLMLKLHHMTDETLAKVLFVGVKEAMPGVKVFGQIRLKEPMAMMRGDRFILRDPAVNATVGGGKILLPCGKKRSRLEMAQYQILDSQDLRKILVLLLSDSETNSHAARLMLNLSEKKFKELLGNNNKEIITLPLSPFSGDRFEICPHRGIKGEGKLMLRENLKKIEQRIIDVINKYHSDMPGDSGIDENSLRAQLRFIKRGILPAILDNLIITGRIAKTGNVVYMPSHKPEARGLEKEIEDAILSLFSNNGFNPVKKEELLNDAQWKALDKKLAPAIFKRGDVEKVFQLLLKRGMIVKITEDSYISKDTLDKTKDKLINWVTDKGKVKAAEFRDILGCGRKFAIELLEYFDKERVTLRSGDYRVLRKILSVKQ